jgi:hypothetical protein
MTTFTMQDLTPTDIPTREEEEAMIELGKATLEKMGEGKSNTFVENTSTTDTSTIIQGATGAQYRAVDTSPQAKPNIHQLAQQLTQSFTTLVNAILELQTQTNNKQEQPVSGGEGLREAVDTVLQNAEWFTETVGQAVDAQDFDELVSEAVSDKVSDEVDNYFSYNFNIEDHCDIHDIVQDKVDSVIDGVVEEKLAELIEEKLQNISISFN